jgi:GTP-binding protein
MLRSPRSGRLEARGRLQRALDAPRAEPRLTSERDDEARKDDVVTTDPSPDEIEAGRKLFAGEAGFVWAADSLPALPPMARVEIAFAGRSNVGKSSLVNALTGRNTLARTSHTPGRTQQLNFFDVNGRFHLVDMPGYGYAAVAKEKVQAWTKLIHDYLRGRQNLARVYVLIDARHGLKPIDLGVLDALDKAAVSYQVVLTKADALKAGAIAARVAETAELIARRPAAFPEVLPTSSRTGAGIPDLRAGIARLLAERT